MVQFFACYSACQNPHDGKDKLAGGTLNEESDRPTPAPTTIHAPTPAIAPIIAPLVASDPADSFVVRYSEDDLQRIVRTIFEARPLFFLALASVPLPSLCKMVNLVNTQG